MIFNPHTYDPSAYDPETQRQLKALIQFFEDKGLAEMKQEFHDRTWYQDFLDFNAKEGILAAFGTPAASRWGRRPMGHRPDQRPQRDPRLLLAVLLVRLAGDGAGSGPRVDE
jgi:hypothetical protein